MKTVQAAALGSILTLAASLLLGVGAARADDVAFGPRLGYTHDTNLDQIHFGGQVAFRNISSNLHVVPSLELGLGDGSLLALNGDLVWEFTEMASGGWSYYAGGGPLLSHYKRNRHSSTDFALSLVAGFTRELKADRAWFGEVRLGLEDAPVLKLTVGLFFY